MCPAMTITTVISYTFTNLQNGNNTYIYVRTYIYPDRIKALKWRIIPRDISLFDGVLKMKETRRGWRKTFKKKKETGQESGAPVYTSRILRNRDKARDVYLTGA